MSNHADITALRAHFIDLWGDLTPLIIPGADDPRDEPNEAYCVLRVMPNGEERQTIGPAPSYDAKGLVWIDVFSPIADGDAQAWSLADRAAAIYREWRSDDGRIYCYKVDYRNGADEGQFMRVIITVSYRAEH